MMCAVSIGIVAEFLAVALIAFRLAGWPGTVIAMAALALVFLFTMAFCKAAALADAEMARHREEKGMDEGIGHVHSTFSESEGRGGEDDPRR